MTDFEKQQKEIDSLKERLKQLEDTIFTSRNGCAKVGCISYGKFDCTPIFECYVPKHSDTHKTN